MAECLDNYRIVMGESETLWMIEVFSQVLCWEKHKKRVDHIMDLYIW